MRMLGRLAGLLLALMLPLEASAHLMAAWQGTVRVVGDSAYTVVSVPVSVLDGVDDNRDGFLTLAELNAHRNEIDRQISARLRYDADGKPGRLVFGDLLISHLDQLPPQGTDTIIAMRRYQWDGPLRSLHLHADFFDKPATRDAQLTIRALRSEPDAATGKLHDKQEEVSIFDRHRTDHEFFAGAWAAFFNYAAMGTEHILLGIDHLLFLLTILVVGAGWRYWLAVVTTFTLAHSVTLTLAALNIVQAPSRWIEPLIAASIVFMGLDNLLRAGRALRQRIAVVFACGLVHGLGIASALTETGLNGEHRALGLVGFNLGVEFGQMLFVGAMLALFALIKMTFPAPMHARATQACSALAVLVGSFWMVQRMWGA